MLRPGGIMCASEADLLRDAAGALCYSLRGGAPAWRSLGDILGEEGERMLPDPATRIRIGCLVKPLVASITGLLCDEGTLAPDTRVGEVLPELSRCPAGKQIQVKDLLTHRSGLLGLTLGSRGIRELWDWEELALFVQVIPLLLPPGAAYSYMHTDYVLLTEILERVTGRTLDALLERYIWSPLSLLSGMEADRHSASVPGARFDSTAGRYVVSRPLHVSPLWKGAVSDRLISIADLTKFLEASTSTQNPWNSRFLAEACNQLGSIPGCVSIGRREALPIGFSAVWTFFGKNLFGHNSSSSGLTAALRFNRENGMGATVVVTPNVPTVRDALVNQVVEAPDTVSGQLPPDLELWAGEYSGISELSLSIRHTGSELALSIGPSDRGEIRPLEIVWTRRPGETWMLKRQDSSAAVGFFVDRSTGSRCVMFGMAVFRRLSD